MKLFLTIYMPLLSNTHLLEELFLDLLRISSLSPEMIFRTTSRLTTQLPGWYNICSHFLHSVIEFVYLMLTHPKRF